MAADLTDIRTAIRAVLIASSTLTSLLGSGDRVFYGRIRKAAVIPSVILLDTGTRPDVTVPLHTRTLTAEIFANNYDQAEDIAKTIRGLLDGIPPNPGPDWKMNVFHFVAEREAPVEEGDIVNKSLDFTYSAYDIT